MACSRLSGWRQNARMGRSMNWSAMASTDRERKQRVELQEPQVARPANCLHFRASAGLHEKMKGAAEQGYMSIQVSCLPCLFASSCH